MFWAFGGNPSFYNNTTMTNKDITITVTDNDKM